MSVKTNSLIARLVFLGLVAGCSASTAPIVQVPQEVADAPNEIVVGNATLRLNVFPWRDFQPGVGPTDTRLMAQFQIEVTGGSLPSGLRVERGWLVRENEAWISVPQQEGTASSATRVEYMSRGGPTWPVGTLVTGVLQLRDAANNSYLLRSSAQAIVRTD